MTMFAERDYTSLSGGELQRVLIARALAQQSGLLVMDEPTANLDFRQELKVLELIADLVKRQAISALISTHYLNQAFYLENESINTTVALMNNERFEQVGSPAQVLTADRLKHIFDIETEVTVSHKTGRQFILALRSTDRRMPS